MGVGSTATATLGISGVGTVNSFAITNSGAGYTIAPQIVVSVPDPTFEYMADVNTYGEGFSGIVTGITTTQDDLVVSGKLKMQGTALGSSDIILSGGSDAICMIANQNSVSNLSRIGINCHNNANNASLQVAEFNVGASNAVGFKWYATEIDFTNLPTSNPGVAGRLWRSGNDVKISTG